jgi:arylformamidase
MPRRIYDISLTIEPGMLAFEGDPPVAIHHSRLISHGDPYNLTALSFGSHTGTHMDAPRHFNDRNPTMDEVSLDHFYGPARVLEIPGKEAIQAQDLRPFEIQRGEIILLKTRNSEFIRERQFRRDFSYLTLDAAQHLLDSGILTIGIDYLSLEKFDSQDFAVHHTLLDNNIIILEGLVLAEVPAGDYQLIALPLKIKEGDGSPVRAILVREE